VHCSRSELTSKNRPSLKRRVSGGRKPEQKETRASKTAMGGSCSRARLLKSITMTREQEIAKRMNELEQQYRETRDEKITDELSELARELKKLKKQ
jgi:hypothetical protein